MQESTSAQDHGRELPVNAIAVVRALSEATVANMKQNLAFAAVYNSTGVTLAAGLPFSFTGWLQSPMITTLAISLSSVSVITSSLWLRRARREPQ